MGGSLYNTPISLPLYHHNDTSLTNTTSYAAIDAITSFTIVNLVPHTIALSLSVLTLLHALLLVPPRKRHSSMFVLLTLCLALQTITSSAAVYLNVYGGYAASYPLLTRDVVTSHYSTGYRTALVIFHLASVLILVPLNVAFYILSRSLLTWVRLKFTRYAYFGILGYLLFNTFMWVSFRMALAGYTINNIALVSVLDPLLTTRWAWKFFKNGEGVSGSVCVAAWSCTIGAASVSVLRARRELFRIEQGTSGTRKVVGERTAFDISLNLLAIVGVQSFIVPGKLYSSLLSILLSVKAN